MRVTAPIAAGVLSFVLCLGIVWQAMSLWSPVDRGRVLVAGLPSTSGLPSASAVPRAASPVLLPAGDRPAPPVAAPAPAPPASSAVPAPAASALAARVAAATAGPSPSSSTAPAAPVKPTTPQPDETALRTFARQGDTRRLNAEIARLRSLYPAWTPPDDPLKAPVVSDPQIDRLWQLYAAGDFAELRAAIAARHAAEPAWQVPADLLDRLAVAETRERLINASDARQFDTVVRLAATTSSLLTCGDVDVLWRVGEAFGRTNKPERAADAYRYILTSCPRAEDRLATAQKAAVVLPRATIEPLLELGHGDEFAGVRDDLARRAVAVGGADAKAMASPDDLTRLQRTATVAATSTDAMLLGWYAIRHEDPVGAEHWFRLAHERADTALSSQGLALALIALKRPDEAEAVLYRWRDASDDTRKTYMAATANLLSREPPVPISADVLTRIVASVGATRDAASAQQLGWYAHGYGQEETAAQWFGTTLGWKPDDEASAFGLALVDARLGRRAALSVLVAQWGSRSVRILALMNPRALASRPDAPSGFPTDSKPRTDSRYGGDHAAPALIARSAGQSASPEARTLSPAEPMPGRAMRDVTDPAPSDRQPRLRDRSERSRQAGSHSTPAGGCTQGGLPRAWCLMQLNRPSEAIPVFQAVLQQNALGLVQGPTSARQDAAYGLSLAYLRLGLTGEAAVASTQASQPAARAGELGTAILTQRITSAYGAGRYRDALLDLDARAHVAPEQTDLLNLRGWCYYHLGRYKDAEQVFGAVAATGDRQAIAGLVAARGAQRGSR